MQQNTPPRHLLWQQILLTHFKHCVLFIVLPAGFFYALLLRLLTLSGFSIIEAIRDPMQQTEVSSWLGLLSNLGVFITAAAAVICFFVFSTGLSVQKYKRECLLLVGLLSALLATDDFFLIHDRYIDQKICYLSYAVCLVALLFRHYKTIFKVDGPAFLLAGGFLALSISTDLVQGALPLSYTHSQILEEGFKFVGMATWLYFSYRLAMTYVVARVTPKQFSTH